MQSFRNGRFFNSVYNRDKTKKKSFSFVKLEVAGLYLMPMMEFILKIETGISLQLKKC